jgi:acyl carrier protein|uniref:acyl carrier protein n=1 Tax=Eubacterium cellulosolvens TaxID=29322 RepID=UPI0004863EC8|nr:acyl carrier protein [[Eubacterium] cellulosolvens]
MDRQDIKETIKKTLAEMMGKDRTAIGDEDLFYEDLGADSIMIVQVFLTCQEKYDVLLSDELNLMEPVSVNVLTDIICRKLDEKAS